MKYGKLAKAHPALVKLANQDMPLNILLEFSDVLNSLSPLLEDYYKKLEKIYSETEENEGNSGRIATLEEEEFFNALLPLRLPAAVDIRLSYVDMQLLNGIIEIER